VNEVVAQTCVAPPPGLVSWWPGDGNALDIQDGNDGTLQNEATFGPGKVGQAFSFDGVDDYVSIPDDPQLETAGAHTVEAWIRITNQASAGAVLTKYRSNTSEDGWSLVVLDDGTIEVIVKSDIGQAFFILSTQTVNDGNFHHLAMTWNTNGGTVKLYIDGVLTDESLTISGTFSSNSRNVLIGGRFGPTDDVIVNFEGDIDEVSFYSQALSATDITAIFNAGSAGKCRPMCTPPPSGLVSWWPGDGNALDIQDGNDGTLQNEARSEERNGSFGGLIFYGSEQGSVRSEDFHGNWLLGADNLCPVHGIGSV